MQYLLFHKRNYACEWLQPPSPPYFWVLFFFILLRHCSLRLVHCWAGPNIWCPNRDLSFRGFFDGARRLREFQPRDWRTVTVLDDGQHHWIPGRHVKERKEEDIVWHRSSWRATSDGDKKTDNPQPQNISHIILTNMFQ